MVKANELRLGNYITDETGDIDTVKSLNSYAGDQINEDYYENQYIGIPLTKEWLLKLGFEPSPFLNGNILHTIGVLHLLLSDSLNSYGCSFDPENNNSWFTEVQYVHQLQNLYFAITGEELTIKEHTV